MPDRNPSNIRRKREDSLRKAERLYTQRQTLRCFLYLIKASLFHPSIIIAGSIVTIIIASQFPIIRAVQTPDALGKCSNKSGNSEQAAYQCAIIQDRKALQPGYVAIQDDIRIPLEEPYTLVVTACGSESLSCSSSHPSTAIAKTEPPQLRGRIKVGAYLSMTVTGDIPSQNLSYRSEVQPVITPDDAATWYWEVTPSRTGVFKLWLTVTPLLASTKMPLTTGISFPIKVTVTSNAQQRIAAFFESGHGVLAGIAGLLGLLGLTISGVAAWCYRRIRKIAAPKVDPAMDRSDKSESPETTDSAKILDHRDEQDRPATTEDRP